MCLWTAQPLARYNSNTFIILFSTSDYLFHSLESLPFDIHPNFYHLFPELLPID
uniref:Uncharacterized protein n=1 Tax=Octopus bimaculoides TaxID=37653 RepID=A0A0L8HAX9_OCTBM